MFRLHSLEEWRHDYANIALSGGNLVILMFDVKLGSQAGWKIAFVLIGLTSAWAWFANLKRYRTVADTPPSRIASAPQGYIEAIGSGKQPPGEKLASPVTGLPWWYRYRIEEKKGNDWNLIESGISHVTFGVDDGSGLMRIDPEGAEITGSRREIRRHGNLCKTEWLLMENQMLYVIGEHVTLGGPNAVLDKRADISELLSEWKRNKRTLLARFDTNRDG